MPLVPLGEPQGRDRWLVEHGERSFLVLRHRDEWHVVDALCPHRQGRMIDGLIRDDALVCPSHWYVFDLADGRCRTTRDYTLGVYDVIERDGTLLADIPDRPKRSWSDILHAHARDSNSRA